MFLYENTNDHTYGHTIASVRATYPKVSIPDGIPKYKEWVSYQQTQKPYKEFYTVVETNPKDGLQQWKLIPPNDLDSIIKSVQKTIDTAVSEVIVPFNNFRQSYYDKENDAKEYEKNEFTGEPGLLLKNYADEDKLGYKDAALKILKEAEFLRTMEKTIEMIRMKKYSLKTANDLDEVIAKRDSILQLLREISNKAKEL